MIKRLQLIPTETDDSAHNIDEDDLAQVLSFWDQNDLGLYIYKVDFWTLVHFKIKWFFKQN